MAESSARNEAQKFCLEYYNSQNCSNGSNCQYSHKLRYEVEPIAFIGGVEYFLGHINNKTNQRVCHFYPIGKCIYQNNCRFLHDNEYVNSNNLNSSESDCETSTAASTNNMPSTSTADLFCYNEETELTDTNEIEQQQKELRNKQITKINDNDLTLNCVLEKGVSAPSPLVIINNKNWVDAPEFIPRFKPKSYAEVLSPEVIAEKNLNRRLCPYTTKEGICMNLIACSYVHGDICDMCGRFVLHPYDEEERKKHQQECLKQHEKNMELSFAIARSKEKTCGVCFEIIMEKANGEQRFGILPNCNHCFCLTCIRKWRQARQFENKIIRACPECRVTSDFVCPSMYWVDTKEDKDKLIEDYKKALARKDCKYFKKGEGKCPFGNKCFYLHASIDGSKVDVGPPPRQRRGRNVDADMDVLQVMLWDFLDERDFPWQSLADDLEDLVSFFTDSDESDWSDYELFLD